MTKRSGSRSQASRQRPEASRAWRRLENPSNKGPSISTTAGSCVIAGEESPSRALSPLLTKPRRRSRVKELPPAAENGMFLSISAIPRCRSSCSSQFQFHESHQLAELETGEGERGETAGFGRTTGVQRIPPVCRLQVMMDGLERHAQVDTENHSVAPSEQNLAHPIKVGLRLNHCRMPT